MKHLDRLLTDAFSQELENVLPAPVDKQAVTSKTFQKLGLEQPVEPAPPQGEWAAPVTRRYRPWAVLAACLALALIAGVGISLRPMSVNPGTQSQTSSLSAEVPPVTGTYFELSVTDATFDEDAWAVTLDLEATTDMDLDNANASELYGWDYRLAFHTKDGDVEPSVYYGESRDIFSQWTETGENTYRCSPLVVRLDPEYQKQTGLIGQFDTTLSLTVTDLTQGMELPIQFFPKADFTVDLPEQQLPKSISGIVLDSVKIADAENAPTLGLTAQIICDLPLDQNPEEASLWSARLSFTDAAGKSFELFPVEGTTLSWEPQEYEGEDSLYQCAPVYFPFPQELSGQEITGHFILSMPEEKGQTESIPEMALAFTLELPSLEGGSSVNRSNAPTSFDNTQEEVYNKMLNSVDYFSTARVNFTVMYPGDDQTWKYQIETNLDTGIAHGTCTTSIDPNFSQETYADGSNVWEYDNQAKTVFAAGSIEKRHSLEEEWPGLAERYYVDENGDPNYCYRSDPTNASGARECLFPQEYAFGYLSDKDLWTVEGSVEYCGRQCFNVVGKVSSSYAAQTGADQFQMYVDQETGILLMLDARYGEETVGSVTVSEITIDDPDICRAFNYDMSRYENYTPLKSSPSAVIIGGADGPTKIYTTP